MKTVIKLFGFLLAGLVVAGCSKSGCTDPTAVNYSSEATEDNGFCQYPTTVSVKSVSVEYEDSRIDGTSWDAVGSPDTYIMLDDLTSEEIIYEAHHYLYSDTIEENTAGLHRIDLTVPFKMEVVERKPHFKIVLFDMDDSGESISQSEEMVSYDFYDMSWFTTGENKFPRTLKTTGDGFLITLELEWTL